MRSQWSRRGPGPWGMGGGVSRSKGCRAWESLSTAAHLSGSASLPAWAVFSAWPQCFEQRGFINPDGASSQPHCSLPAHPRTRGGESSPARPTPRAPGRRLLGRCLALAPTVSALTWLCFPAGHRRAGAPAADASHRAGVHGAEAGARHQAVPSDRESEGGFLRPVRQLTLPSAEEAGPLCW